MSLSLRLLDVGHGDSLILITPSGKYCIIDINRNSNCIPILEFIKQHKVRAIEFICITHYHVDHYDGLLELLDYCQINDIKITNFFDSGVTPKSLELLLYPDSRGYYNKTMDRVIGMAEEGKLNYYSCGSKTMLFDEGGLSIQALAPDALQLHKKFIRRMKRLAKMDNQSINSLSIVLFVKYDGIGVLLLSDADNSSQNKICGKYGKSLGRISVFKTSHHGSFKYFLENIYDQFQTGSNCFALISAGCKYADCPSENTINVLKNKGFSVYATNTFEFSKKGVQLMEEDSFGDATEYLISIATEPVSKFRSLIPYHGDIEMAISGDNIGVTTQIGYPSL